MANYIVTDTELTSIADAIRTKGGTQGSLTFPAGFVTAIGNISGGGNANWMGKNPDMIFEPDADGVAFEDTPWATWTPTTTATTLSSAETYTSISINLADYDYLVHTQMYEALYYGSGSTAKARLTKACFDHWGIVTRYASNRTNLISATRNGNSATSVFSQALMDYYNTSGTQTVTMSWGYGLYPTATAPSLASSTAASTTLYVRQPQLNARCSTSYLTTANAGKVDSSASYYQLYYQVWRVDAGSSILRAVQDNRMAMYNNGL